MDVTVRHISHSDSGCVEAVEADRQFSADVLARCRGLFAVGAAKSSQEVEEHMGCPLEVLKRFEEHQLLEQVRGMHGLGSGPLKRGLAFSELAAILPVLQAYSDQPLLQIADIHGGGQRRKSAAAWSAVDNSKHVESKSGGGKESGDFAVGERNALAECGAGKHNEGSMEGGKDTEETYWFCSEAKPLLGNAARKGHLESKDGDAAANVPRLSTSRLNASLGKEDEETDRCAGMRRGRRHCLPEQPLMMQSGPNFTRGQNHWKERPRGETRQQTKPSQKVVSIAAQPTYSQPRPSKPSGNNHQLPGRPPLAPVVTTSQITRQSPQGHSLTSANPSSAKAQCQPVPPVVHVQKPGQSPSPSASAQELEAATLRAARQLISALRFMVSAARQGHPLSLNLLLRAHGFLMDGLCSRPGQLRKTGCKAGDGFQYPPPKEVLWRTRRWIVESNRLLSRADLTPWTKASHILLVFVHEIHPFQDGNGRMCRLLMNFVLAGEGLPFTVLLTRGGLNRARYVRGIKESYRVGSCVPMTRRVLYAVDDARKALERFRKLSGGAGGKGVLSGGGPLDGVPLGRGSLTGTPETTTDKGRADELSRKEARSRNSDAWDCVLPNGTRNGKASARGPQVLHNLREERWPSASSTAATVEDTDAPQNRPCSLNPGQIPDRAIHSSCTQKSFAPSLERTNLSPGFALSPFMCGPSNEDPYKALERPFIDGVPEASGRQVYGDRQGRKRARPPSEPPSSNGTGGGNDTGSDDTGTSDSGGGSQAPSGGGQDGDSGDTGSDDSAAENSDTGTEDGSSSQEESVPDGSEADSAATPAADGTDTGSSDSDTQPVASFSSDTQPPTEDGSTEESDMVPVQDSDTGSSEEEGIPGEATDSGSESYGTAAEDGFHGDTSDSEVHGVALSDSGSEDVAADDGSDSSETGADVGSDLGSFSDSAASEDSDDGSDEVLVGWGVGAPAAPAPAPPAPAAPAPSVRIDIVPADDELPDKGGEADTCTICMERKKNGVVIPCGHVFCRRCAEQLRAERGKCAVCNKEIVGAYKLYGG